MIDLSSLTEIAQEFIRFIYDTFISLLNIPPSISITTAIILTFTWLYSEFISIVRIMRGLVVAAWALTLGNSFFAGRSTATLEFWLLAGVVVALNLAWILLRGRGILTCSSCGNTSRFNGTISIKRGKTIEFETISCAECGSSEVKRRGKVERKI